LLHLLQVQTLRQALFLLRRTDAGQRAGGQKAALHQELVEAPQRRQLTSGRALGVVLAVQVREEFADRVRLALDVLFIDRSRRGLGIARRAVRADFAAKVLRELNQVRAVALDRVIAEMLLELEVVEKLLNQGRKRLLSR